MKARLECEVLVAGGGPAGATAAYLLASRGLDVRLFDKCHFPRPKLCAGLLTWKSIRLLERIFSSGVEELQRLEVVVHACREYRIYYRQKEIARGILDFPFHFVDRKRYDHHWLQKAAAAGAHIETGVAVTEVDPACGDVVLKDGRTVHARIIVGADGVWSKVRQSLCTDKVSRKRWLAGLASTIEGYRTGAAGEVVPAYAALHFGHAAWSYGWSFPGPGQQSLGVALLKRKHRGSLPQAFLSCLRSLQIEPQELHARFSHPLPYGNYLGTPGAKRVLLVGDACGLADPLLGEGIYYAHRSAQIADQALLESAGDWDRVASLYDRMLRREVIRELRWIKFWRTLLFAGGRSRRYRGLELFFRLFPKRVEAAVQGTRPFSKLIWPGSERTD